MSSLGAISQFSRFVAVGVCNTLLSYSVIFACMYLGGMTAEISNAVGYAVGFVASYFLNKMYTFKSVQNSPQEVIRFLAVFGVAYAANLAMLFALIHRMGVPKGPSQVYAGILYTCVSFFLNKFYVFTDWQATQGFGIPVDAVRGIMINGDTERL
jgi:putative flippase GtrA